MNFKYEPEMLLVDMVGFSPTEWLQITGAHLQALYEG